MSTYVCDAGSRYLVKANNIEEAYAWLEYKGEFAHKVGIVRDCIELSADGFEDMWCGNVCWGYAEEVAKFMDLFCESGSYACFYCDDYNEYTLVWKEGGLVQEETITLENPFSERIQQLERSIA